MLSNSKMLDKTIDKLLPIVQAKYKVAKLEANTRAGHRVWTAEEEKFIEDNIGVMSDEEIGKALGRTYFAVRVHRTREMRIKAQSKVPNVITAHRAAQALGIDSHKMAHWADKGLIPTIKNKLMTGNKIPLRLIKRQDFINWALKFENWIYFDIRKVKDVQLRKMIKKEWRRLGKDEWWRTAKVAKYHGVETKDVMYKIRKGKIEAFQVPVSYGGRDRNPTWRIWFIKKSVAKDPKLTFVYPGKGMYNISKVFTAEQIKLFVELYDKKGLNFAQIARKMKMKEHRGNQIKFWYCRAKGLPTTTKFTNGRPNKKGVKHA